MLYTVRNFINATMCPHSAPLLKIKKEPQVKLQVPRYISRRLKKKKKKERTDRSPNYLS
jgi:hypothetical protein